MSYFVVDPVFIWVFHRLYCCCLQPPLFKGYFGNQIQEETRYYTGSLMTTAERFSQLIRGHRSIENQLHWHLDVSFNKDKNRVRKDNGSENMNIMRKLALQILKSIKKRQKNAGWDNDYPIEILEPHFSRF